MKVNYILVAVLAIYGSDVCAGGKQLNATSGKQSGRTASIQKKALYTWFTMIVRSIWHHLEK
ncbi:MAG: hypothetical protein LBB29_00305 [Holosporaceae bacterium]|jgi:hypothetical protein|nr:hypothetical protein [Holosporaceae bacterium]